MQTATKHRHRLHDGVVIGRLLVAMAAMLVVSVPSLADWRQDAKSAAIKYADDKKDELIKSQAKAAVFALYKKLYSAKSGANRNLSRALAEIAISAPELNKLAEEAAEAYGSGDPDKMREASEKVAVKFGEQLSRLASNPETRGLLGSIIGSADKVKEVSEFLGHVAAGTDESRRAAASYVGQVLINLTPGAGVVGFYQTAHGAMSYANNEYVDSKIEDLYKAYKNGDAHARELLLDQLRAGTGGYGYVIENRRKELEQEKIDAIGDAAEAASERVREHLTKTTQDEAIRSILASFDGRIEKERKDPDAAVERDKIQKEAEAILKELDWAGKGRYGGDWYAKHPYDLEKFTSIVRDQLNADGVLDPKNLLHVQLMSKAASIAMIYGKNSKEYAKVLAELAQAKKNILETNMRAQCLPGSPTEGLSGRLWQKGRKLVDNGKIAAALPVLKQSLELCPDDKRAQYVALLSKTAAPTAAVSDTFVGTVIWTDGAQTGEIEGAINLTIANGNVTGTMTVGRGDVSRKAKISGRVTADGRLTATLEGKSVYKGDTPDLAKKLVATLVTFPFGGTLAGTITDGQGSGTFQAQSTDQRKPVPISGTWTASAKVHRPL